MAGSFVTMQIPFTHVLKPFIPEIPSLFIQRPIVARRQKAALYHPFVEAVALTIVDIPITFFMSLLFGTIIYEAVRL